MAEFLVGADLSAKIRFVLAGSGVRCAVAFVGRQAPETLFSLASDGLKGVRLICNVTMGSTHPTALEAFGAPRNKNLRHHPSLHAKVYISDRGAVIGSANASARGTGRSDDDPAVLVEAGTFHAKDSPPWLAASRWFDAFFEESPQVDRATVELARTLWSEPSFPIALQLSPRRGSILDSAIARPEHFPGVGFAFTNQSPTKESIEDARTSAKLDADEDICAIIDDTSYWNVYTNWGEVAAASWPGLFFGFHMPRKKLYISAFQRMYADVKSGNIFVARASTLMKKIIVADLPSAKESKKIDASLAERIIARIDGGNRIFPNSFEFSNFVRKEFPEIFV